MKTGLAFRTAQQQVLNYEQEANDVMKDHRDAMDCRDCEACLQLGINAYEWLVRADAEVRRAYSCGEMEFDEDLDRVFQDLCRAWLRPCAAADAWAQKQIKRGFSVDNLDKFQQCCREMQAIVEFYGSDPNEAVMPPALVIERDKAIIEHANGQTSEFI